MLFSYFRTTDISQVFSCISSFIFSYFWRLESPRSRFLQGSHSGKVLFCLANGHRLTVFSYGLSSVCAHRERKRERKRGREEGRGEKGEEREKEIFLFL